MIARSTVDNCLAARARRLDSICKSEPLSGCIAVEDSVAGKLTITKVQKGTVLFSAAALQRGVQTDLRTHESFLTGRFGRLQVICAFVVQYIKSSVLPLLDF